MPKDCISSTGWAVRALAVTLAGLALSGIAPPITWAAEADAKGPGEYVGAAEAFESLYGQDVERVRGTSEPADDIALAKRLLSAARDTTGTPALLRVLCNEAYSLAAAYPDAGIRRRSRRRRAWPPTSRRARSTRRTVSSRSARSSTPAPRVTPRRLRGRPWSRRSFGLPTRTWRR